MPSPRRVLLLLVVTAVLTGLAIGLLPPVFADGAPETVMRTAALDAERLAEGAGVRVDDGAISSSGEAWTSPQVVCAPIRFTMVAVTWRQDGDTSVPVRVAWGPRDAMAQQRLLLGDPDEGPDPGSAEDRGIVGTHPLWTGESECARIRIRLPAGETLDDLRVVFINSSGTATDPSPLASFGMALARGWEAAWAWARPQAASALAKKPAIITRSGWGADESTRDKHGYCSGPGYAGKLKMAYVHHTVNSNDYSKADAAGIVRGIYSYHVNSRGFCDIGYNFLIDRFGRIYEGRFGGMGRPVIGAHAMGFNTGSTGVAAIGDYTSKVPPWKVRNAYKRVLAWRLDLAHQPPKGFSWMTSAGGSNTKYGPGETVRLRVISGHRDTGYTACPGQKLYDKLSWIRKAAHARGLPKIFRPKAKPKQIVAGQESVHFTARLTGNLDWSIQISDQTGRVVRTLKGTGSNINRKWKGMSGGLPVVPGEYTAVVAAENASGSTSRPKKFTLTVLSPLP